MSAAPWDAEKELATAFYACITARHERVAAPCHDCTVKLLIAAHQVGQRAGREEFAQTFKTEYHDKHAGYYDACSLCEQQWNKHREGCRVAAALDDGGARDAHV